jgi:hypothetical protein
MKCVLSLHSKQRENRKNNCKDRKGEPFKKK